MEQLLEDYKRRLYNVTKLLDTNHNNGSIIHQRREERLSTKAEVYRSLISELEKMLRNKPEYIKKSLSDMKQKAIKLACAKTGFKESEDVYVSFNEDEIEVNFSFPSGCSCCSDDEHTIIFEYTDLNKDIDAYKKEQEQKREEEETRRQNELKIQKQKESEEKEKSERALYEKLKQKYE